MTARRGGVGERPRPPTGPPARRRDRRVDVRPVHGGAPPPGRVGRRRLRALLRGAGGPGRGHHRASGAPRGARAERRRDARARRRGREAHPDRRPGPRHRGAAPAPDPDVLGPAPAHAARASARRALPPRPGLRERRAGQRRRHGPVRRRPRGARRPPGRRRRLSLERARRRWRPRSSRSTPAISSGAARPTRAPCPRTRSGRSSRTSRSSSRRASRSSAIRSPGLHNEMRPGSRRYNFIWYRVVDDAGLREMCTDAEGRHHEFSIPPPLIRDEVIADHAAGRGGGDAAPVPRRPAADRAAVLHADLRSRVPPDGVRPRGADRRRRLRRPAAHGLRGLEGGGRRAGPRRRARGARRRRRCRPRQVRRRAAADRRARDAARAEARDPPGGEPPDGRGPGDVAAPAGRARHAAAHRGAPLPRVPPEPCCRLPTTPATCGSSATPTRAAVPTACRSWCTGAMPTSGTCSRRASPSSTSRTRSSPGPSTTKPRRRGPGTSTSRRTTTSCW